MLPLLAARGAAYSSAMRQSAIQAMFPAIPAGLLALSCATNMVTEKAWTRPPMYRSILDVTDARRRRAVRLLAMKRVRRG